jgi:hypothetical protein
MRKENYYRVQDPRAYAIVGFLVVLLCIISAPGSLLAQATLNGLEKAEGQHRAATVKMATSRVGEDQKAATKAQEDLAAAPAKQAAAVSQAQAAGAAATDAYSKDKAAKELAAAQQITTKAQENSTRANKQLAKDQKAMASEQARADDWNKKTLATHKAMGKTIDWQKGTIQ